MPAPPPGDPGDPNIQHDAGPGTPVRRARPDRCHRRQVAPAADEPVIVKALIPTPSVGTDLEAQLKGPPGARTLFSRRFHDPHVRQLTTRGAFNLASRLNCRGQPTATTDLAYWPIRR